MNSLIRTAVGGQYGAALTMMRQCVDRADAQAWRAAVGRSPFWHVAYHALYITDLYLSAGEAAFRPQPFHREDADVLGPPPASEKQVAPHRPYDKDTLAGYADTCRAGEARGGRGNGRPVGGPERVRLVAVQPARTAPLQHPPPTAPHGAAHCRSPAWGRTRRAMGGDGSDVNRPLGTHSSAYGTRGPN